MLGHGTEEQLKINYIAIYFNKLKYIYDVIYEYILTSPTGQPYTGKRLGQDTGIIATGRCNGSS